MKTEKVFWQEAWHKLKEQYGPELPREFVARMETEQALFGGTGMIQHLSLIGRLEEQGINRDWRYTSYPSLIAWLYGVTPVNPLPPHAWCPHCHRVELHPEVRDGWDLPETKCACGDMMNRDGHDIPLYAYQKTFAEMRRYVDLTIAGADMDQLKALISEEYGDHWKLIQYRYTFDDMDSGSYLNRQGDLYALVWKERQLIWPADKEGVLLIPLEEGPEHFISAQETVLYICADADREPGLGRVMLDAGMGDADFVFLFSLPLHDLWQEYKQFCGMTVRKRADPDDDGLWGSCTRYSPGEAERVWKPELSSYSDQILTISDTDTYYDGSEIAVKEIRYPEADLTPWLPEKPVFSMITHLMGLHGSIDAMIRTLDTLYKHPLKIEDIPATQEELAEIISGHMAERGLHDDELLWKLALPDDSECPEVDVKAEFAALQLPEWLMPFCQYDLADKESLVKSAMIKLYKAGVRRADPSRMKLMKA